MRTVLHVQVGNVPRAGEGAAGICRGDGVGKVASASCPGGGGSCGSWARNLGWRAGVWRGRIGRGVVGSDLSGGDAAGGRQHFFWQCRSALVGAGRGVVGVLRGGASTALVHHGAALV